MSKSHRITATLYGRLAKLMKDDRRVLAHAALLGYWFDPAILALTMGRDVEDLVGTLQRARDGALIVEEGEPCARFRFRHAIVRAALVDELPPGAAQRLHRKIVRALETLPDVDSHVDELAYHSCEARLPVKALTYSERAGDAAIAVRALAEATRYYDWALSAADGPTSQARLRHKLATVARMEAPA